MDISHASANSGLEAYRRTLSWKKRLASVLSKQASLNIALGTSLQIVPAAHFPSSNANGRFVLVNLQPTEYDEDAHLVIRGKVDEVMQELFDVLGLGQIPEYAAEEVDPTVLRKFESWSFALDPLRDYKKRKAKKSLKEEDWETTCEWTNGDHVSGPEGQGPVCPVVALEVAGVICASVVAVIEERFFGGEMMRPLELLLENLHFE
ncbi:unnamed protein product [Cyprideis torosa]|uniref:protein acetyllysine N-acetyltransferase n=1 Tax=Cyprideis torosa TaxID=163714 RepID=A0A7R8WNU8_9CRUS|nr:unnamed protein product [Cyprideis torosa]CAG0901048.1 unnamed protein product [Cyprideis torosa]